jgi:hypothetical protein
VGSSFFAPAQIWLQFTATPIRRIEGDKIVSENDANFCIPNFFEIEVGMQKLASFSQFSISLKLGIEFAPRRGERQWCNEVCAPPRRAALDVLWGLLVKKPPAAASGDFAYSPHSTSSAARRTAPSRWPHSSRK